MINLRKKHQSQLIVADRVETQPTETRPAQTERTKPKAKAKPKTKSKPRPKANKPPGGGRSQASIPIEQPNGPPRSSEEESDGSILLAIIIVVVGIAIWKWNQGDNNPPAPAPVQQQNEASSGQGPGWWTEDDMPKDTPRQDNQSTSRPVRISQEDQFVVDLRDALVNSLDLNGDGVIDADELLEGSEERQ